jgi:hypothetical protein
MKYFNTHDSNIKWEPVHSICIFLICWPITSCIYVCCKHCQSHHLFTVVAGKQCQQAASAIIGSTWMLYCCMHMHEEIVNVIRSSSCWQYSTCVTGNLDGDNIQVHLGLFRLQIHLGLLQNTSRITSGTSRIARGSPSWPTGTLRALTFWWMGTSPAVIRTIHNFLMHVHAAIQHSGGQLAVHLLVVRQPNVV